MGLFDSIKSAAKQAKQSVAAASTGTFAQLWAAHKDTIIDAILSYATKAAQSGAIYISDDEKYRAYVIDPAWDLLPLPIRMIGRERLRWDSMFQAARSSIFVAEDDTVSIHPDARRRLEQLIAPRLPMGQVESGTARAAAEPGSTDENQTADALDAGIRSPDSEASPRTDGERKAYQ